MSDSRDEGRERFAAQSAAQLLELDDQWFVHCAYWTLLGREPDPGGLVHYVQRLRAGEAKSEILRNLCSSDEYQKRRTPLPGLEEVLAGSPAPERESGHEVPHAPPPTPDELHGLMALDGAEFVDAVYRALLGREADPAGRAFYLKALEEQGDKRRIVAQVLLSDEFSRRKIDAHAIAELLEIRLLRRTGLREKLLGIFKRSAAKSAAKADGAAPRPAGASPAPAPQGERMPAVAPPVVSADWTPEAPALQREAPRPTGTSSIPARSRELLRSALGALTPLRQRARPDAAPHAAITIVSKNYFAQAVTLAQTYKLHHPDHDFIVVLVDRASDDIPERLDCGAEVVEVADLGIPDLSRFIYRYSILELNTAVKPFALAALFEQRGYETLLYIDPDVYVFRPLQAVQDALQAANIVLIPHVRRPYFDDKLPSDASLVKSGTYNLGFIGLRRSRTADELLDWWKTKLYLDCVVDIPNGLFVDQKWMDMVPGFFPDHGILRDPGYDAAYWNLHERPLERRGRHWLVDGSPLVFFHFSGYDPFIPDVLSKHQDRHALAEGTPLRDLTDDYARALFDNGYEASSGWPYAFARLRNGVGLPLEIVRGVMQWAGHNEVRTPCPVLEPDAFCRFLMRRGAVPGRPWAVLLFEFLLRLRPDVAAAFPGAAHSHDDPAFRTWVQTSGVRDYDMGDLLEFEADYAVHDAAEDAIQAIRANGGGELQERFSRALRSGEDFDAFVQGIRHGAGREGGLGEAHADALDRAAGGIGRILHLYFRRADLQNLFPQPWSPEQLPRFAAWLRARCGELELTGDEVSLFCEYATANAQALEIARLLYFHRGQPNRSLPTVFDLERRMLEIGSGLPREAVRDWLLEESPVRLEDQWRWVKSVRPDAELSEAAAVLGRHGVKRGQNLVKRLRDGTSRTTGLVNIAGYFQAPTGMGESARSTRATLDAGGVPCAALALPHPQVEGFGIPSSPEFFGWASYGAAASILVANADAIETALPFLPPSFAGTTRIGYWAWETEELPAAQARNARHFDEIWTPSGYSASAIRTHVHQPVRVVPHTIDFARLHKARARRPDLGLPEEGTLYGFMFDPMSGLERKNVRGLVAAFNQAFRPDDDAYLVLKVNSRGRRNYEFETLLASLSNDRILLVEDSFDRDETFDFLKSLDVYVSLHRSEAFGLTCAEAMALGKAVIASDYSGNLEYMDDRNSLLVPTSRVETSRAHGPYVAGTVWGEPDVAAAAAAMRRTLDAGLRGELGEIAARSVRERLDAKRLCALALESLEGVAARDEAAASAAGTH